MCAWNPLPSGYRQASTAWARPTSAAWSASSGSTVRVAGPGPGPASSAAARTRGAVRPGPVQGLPQVLICRGVLDPVVTVRTSLGVVTGRSGASVPAGAGRLFAVGIGICDWRRRRSVGRGRVAAPAAGTAVGLAPGSRPGGGRGAPAGAGESGAVLHLVRGAVESMAHHQGAVEPGGQTDVVHAADDGVCGCS